VLFAEDDEADAYLIGRALSDHPGVRRVVRARDGFEALTMVEGGEVAPDLAFIDLHMPLMNGFDLLVALAGCPGPAFPMVVLTSSAARNDAIKCRLRSATSVITKPDSVAELFAVLATAIEAACPRDRALAIRPHRTPDYLLKAPPRRGLRLVPPGDPDDA
jgi:CheY-like chemotaxis protein